MPLLKFSKYLKEDRNTGSSQRAKGAQAKIQSNTLPQKFDIEKTNVHPMSHGSDMGSIRTSELDAELMQECQKFSYGGELFSCLHEEDFVFNEPKEDQEAKKGVSTGFDDFKQEYIDRSSPQRVPEYTAGKSENVGKWHHDMKDNRPTTPVQRKLFDSEENMSLHGTHLNSERGTPSREIQGRGRSPLPTPRALSPCVSDGPARSFTETGQDVYSGPQRVQSPSTDTRPYTTTAKFSPAEETYIGSTGRDNKVCEKPPVRQGDAKIISGAIIMLDENNRFKPITHSDEVSELIRQLQSEEPQMLDTTITEKLQQFQSMDFDTCLHYANTGSFLQELQETNKITDVTVTIGARVFNAHRVALACYSDYFRELFCNTNQQKRVPISIRLHGIRSESFELFLKYVYTGEISVTPELVGDLIVMAEKLKIPPLKHQCIEFMDNLPLDQAVLMVKSGAVSSSTELYDCAMSCIANNFSQFRLLQMFLSLDIATACIILSYDHLKIESEVEVFYAALHWVAQNMPERRQHLSRIMSCVRFAYMTHTELFKCTDATDLLADNAFCRDLLLKANWLITARMNGKKDPLLLQIPKPRNIYAAAVTKQSDIFYSTHSFDGVNVRVEEIQENTVTATNEREVSSLDSNFLAMGQFQNSQGTTGLKEAKLVASYDTSNNQWRPFTELPEPRLHHATATLNGKIFVSGGSDPRKTFKTMPIPTNQTLMYDTQSNQWKQIAPMKTARMFHSLCSLYGMLYAVGGQDENNRVLSSVECYNPRTDNWFYVTPMSVPRLGCAASALDGLLYVAGGYSDTVDKTSGSPVLSQVECFNPKSNKWNGVCNLRYSRCHANLVTVENKLYICGGATRTHTSKESVISSVSAIDCYSKDVNMWEHVTDMVISRHSAGATVIGSKIFILGGICSTANRVLQSMEVYDVKSDYWMKNIEELPFPAKWLSCVAIPCGI